MQFVIVGAGRVGLRTARVLRESGHDVQLVEADEQTADRAREAEFDVVEDDGSHEYVLESAGVDEADAVGALTGDLNTNFVACMIANEHGCRTVMRIDEDYREEIYRQYADAVDEVIYPERLGAIAAKNAMLGGNIRAVADVAHDLQLVEFTITPDAPMRGYSIAELELPGDAELMAYAAGQESLRIPSPDDTLELGDRLVVLSAFDVLADVRSLITGERGRAAARGGA